MATYLERLAVPVRWWVLAGVAVLCLAAVLSVTPVWLLVAGSVVAAVGLGIALRAYTLEVRVDDQGLTAGRATLPWSAMGDVQVLDQQAAAAVRGRDADPRAFLALRGYVLTAVRVAVDDDTDPTPYWYVSTRRPAALAVALAAVRPSLRDGRRDGRRNGRRD